MPRSANQKKKLTTLRSILLERTDHSHPMTMPEIISALAAYDISAERKSVYNDIEILKELGVDIKTVRGKSTGYYVASREFELPELKLLADAVRSSKFIPEKQSGELIKKLSSLAGIHDRKALNRAIFVSNRAKVINSEVYKTVDCIHEAIENNSDITFFYFNWTAEKEKVLRNNGNRYRVSPWALVWDDSNYYLVAFDTEKQGIRHYRVDKMLDAQITEFPRQGKEQFDEYDIASYSSAVFGMFGGKPQRVTLKCENSLANVIIDRFGRDVVILNDGESFRVHVNVVPSDVFFGWVASFGGDADIIAPEDVKKKYNMLLNNFKD